MGSGSERAGGELIGDPIPTKITAPAAPLALHHTVRGTPAPQKTPKNPTKGPGRVQGRDIPISPLTPVFPSRAMPFHEGPPPPSHPV